MSQNRLDLANNEIVSIYLLHPSQVQLEVDATINLFEVILSSQINSFLNYLRITTQANYLVSALNTNFLVGATTGIDIELVGAMVTYGQWSTIGLNLSSYMPCATDNPKSSVGFLQMAVPVNLGAHYQWEEPQSDSPIVNGFYAGCTPFEALLSSTLDCLYDIVCLRLLNEQFPGLQQV